MTKNTHKKSSKHEKQKMLEFLENIGLMEQMWQEGKYLVEDGSGRTLSDLNRGL